MSYHLDPSCIHELQGMLEELNETVIEWGEDGEFEDDIEDETALSDVELKELTAAFEQFTKDWTQMCKSLSTYTKLRTQLKVWCSNCDGD